MWPNLGQALSDSHSPTIVISTLAAILGFCFTVKLVNYILGDFHISVRDRKHHNWRRLNQSSRTCFCSICEILIVSYRGVYCDCCGVCADTACMKKADKKLLCKAMTLSSEGPMKHHWVKGNLTLGAVCEVCEDECGLGPGMSDFQCCWCQHAVHAQCMEKLTEICDLGQYRTMTIPPACVGVANKRRSVRRNLQICSVSPTCWPDWEPLIVLANRKSGNNDGDAVLSLFRRLLNPAQVVDLADRPPEVALEWCALLGGVRTTVLVAGGDGTVAWVLNTIHKLQLKTPPAVAILPLGTGNDLSRVLGWGKEPPDELDSSVVLEQIRRARPVQLDRWSVKIVPTVQYRLGMPTRNMFMYNYLSIGVDAKVTLDFHRTRESQFYLFKNRIFNKFLYLGFGTQEVVEPSCKGLDRRLKVYLDGRPVELPSLESIVILNIPSWGAGVRLWKMGAEDDDDVPEQSFNDGRLEVLGISSSFHIAQLQVGLSQPHRLGQASEVRVMLSGKAPIQVDGEPWEQTSADITVRFCDQATMLQLG